MRISVARTRMMFVLKTNVVSLSALKRNADRTGAVECAVNVLPVTSVRPTEIAVRPNVPIKNVEKTGAEVPADSANLLMFAMKKATVCANRGKNATEFAATILQTHVLRTNVVLLRAMEKYAVQTDAAEVADPVRSVKLAITEVVRN